MLELGGNLDIWYFTATGIRRLSSAKLHTYYLCVILSFAYLLLKYRDHDTSKYIIFLFFYGLFGYLGKDIQNYYKIAATCLVIFWFIKTNSSPAFRELRFLTFSFSFFSITFIYTAILNSDYLLITLSQYSKHLIVFLAFIILYRLRDRTSFKIYLESLLFHLLIVQILLSIIKFIVMGNVESIVGSINSQGGAAATTLPILGFMYIWLKNKGLLYPKDWLFIAGLVFIGFVSLKRAIWFILPIIVFLFYFYVPKKKLTKKVLILSILAIPLIFYFGVRLNFLLNKERVTWGSFDYNYVMDTSMNYMFGKNREKGTMSGRGGATYQVFTKFIRGNLTEKDWFGYGLRYMFATSKLDFYKLKTGVKLKGSATGIFQNLVSRGYLGIFATILFTLSIIMKTRNYRLRIVLLIFFFWEYLFYTGIVFKNYALSFVFIYLVVFSESNIEVSRRKEFNRWSLAW